MLYRSERMEEIFKEPPMVAFRRDRNTCEVLVHSLTNKTVKSACCVNLVFVVVSFVQELVRLLKSN